MDPDRLFQFDLPKILEPTSWVTVRDGGLSHPVEVKVRLAGRTVEIVAIRIDAGELVTSSALRGIRLGDLAEQMSLVLARSGQVHAALEGLPEELRSLQGRQWTANTHVEGRLEDTYRQTGRMARWAEALSVEPTTPEAELSRGRGAKPPTTADLRGFARAYAEELAVRPRGAPRRTARRIGIDPSTAYRWIERCKGEGLLPTDEEEQG